MTIYQCDVCGRHCYRLHMCEAYGTETALCDDCYDYEWEAYDEPADPLLYPFDPRELEDQAEEVLYAESERPIDDELPW